MSVNKLHKSIAPIILVGLLISAMFVGLISTVPTAQASTGTVVMDFTPGSGSSGGDFEDGQWVRDADYSSGGSWNLLRYTDGSKWVIQSNLYQDD